MMAKSTSQTHAPNSFSVYCRCFLRTLPCWMEVLMLTRKWATLWRCGGVLEELGCVYSLEIVQIMHARKKARWQNIQIVYSQDFSVQYCCTVDTHNTTTVQALVLWSCLLIRLLYCVRCSHTVNFWQWQKAALTQMNCLTCVQWIDWKFIIKFMSSYIYIIYIPLVGLCYCLCYCIISILIHRTTERQVQARDRYVYIYLWPVIMWYMNMVIWLIYIYIYIYYVCTSKPYNVIVHVTTTSYTQPCVLVIYPDTLCPQPLVGLTVAAVVFKKIVRTSRGKFAIE